MALNALHTELLQPPTKIGVIGSGCSLATEPTAQISHFYNISHVSMIIENFCPGYCGIVLKYSNTVTACVLRTESLQHAGGTTVGVPLQRVYQQKFNF